MSPAEVTLYGKPGCCLCDEARLVVARVRAVHPFPLEEVDITCDPVLERRYRELIPVLCVDGEEAFRYRVDPDELTWRVATVAR